MFTGDLYEDLVFFNGCNFQPILCLLLKTVQYGFWDINVQNIQFGTITIFCKYEK